MNCKYALLDMEDKNLITIDACQVVYDEVYSDCLELWELIQAINHIVEQVGYNKDLNCDVGNEIKDIK